MRRRWEVLRLVECVTLMSAKKYCTALVSSFFGQITFSLILEECWVLAEANVSTSRSPNMLRFTYDVVSLRWLLQPSHLKCVLRGNTCCFGWLLQFWRINPCLVILNWRVFYRGECIRSFSWHVLFFFVLDLTEWLCQNGRVFRGILQVLALRLVLIYDFTANHFLAIVALDLDVLIGRPVWGFTGDGRWWLPWFRRLFGFFICRSE